MSHFRLLQLVMFAGICLLLLKTTALLIGGGNVLTGHSELQAQEAVNAKDESKQDVDDSAKKKEKNADPAPKKMSAAEEKMMGPDTENLKPRNFTEDKILPSNSELDLLESLSVRRKELNMRETQLKLKENLLKAAQKQVEERIEELKALEAKIQVDLKKKDVLQKNQYQRLVKIYSSMKAKEAAVIFNGLDMPILVDLIRAMKASAGSQILAKMNPDKARALTLKLAQKSQVGDEGSALKKGSDLPEIKGEKEAVKNQ